MHIYFRNLIMLIISVQLQSRLDRPGAPPTSAVRVLGLLPNLAYLVPLEVCGRPPPLCTEQLQSQCDSFFYFTYLQILELTIHMNEVGLAFIRFVLNHSLSVCNFVAGSSGFLEI